MCYIAKCLTALLFVLSGCAPQLKIVVSPAEKNTPDVSVNSSVISKIHTIAVFRFENSKKIKSNLILPTTVYPEIYNISYPYGDDGIILSDRIAQRLLKTFRFKIIDRNNIDKILNEHSLSLSGTVDDKHVIKLGKMIGADAVLVGKVNNCLNIKQWIAEDGRYMTWDVAQVDVSFQIIHVETGEIAVISNHNLNSLKLMKEPVEFDFDRVADDPLKYLSLIPDAETVINVNVDDSIKAILKSM